MNSQQLSANAERPTGQRPALASLSVGARAVAVVAAVAISSLVLGSVVTLFGQPGGQIHMALSEATFTEVSCVPDNAPLKS